jgi:hypothetical protein
MKLFWFIPTHGDGRYLGTPTGGRPLDFDYLRGSTRFDLTDAGCKDGSHFRQAE